MPALGLSELLIANNDYHRIQLYTCNISNATSFVTDDYSS